MQDYMRLKNDNVLLNEKEIKEKKCVLKSKPVYISLEITNACNLHCKTCARNYWDDDLNKIGFMSMETIKRLEPFYPYASQLGLCGYGESMCYNEFWNIVEYLNQYKCKYWLYTNGATMNQANIANIFNNNINTLTISVDAVDSKLFEELRTFSFGRLVENIKSFNKMKKKLGGELPLLTFSFTATRRNINELPKLIELCPGFGVSSVNVSIARIFDASLFEDLIFFYKDMALDVFKTSKELAARLGVTLFLPDINNLPSCHQPFQNLFVKWNGHARACCASAIFTKDPLSIYLGNVNDTSCADLWNSPSVIKARKGMFDEQNRHPICKKCGFFNYEADSYIKII